MDANRCFGHVALYDRDLRPSYSQSFDGGGVLEFIQRWSGTLVLISLLLLPVAGGALFKGGRFIECLNTSPIW